MSLPLGLSVAISVSVAWLVCSLVCLLLVCLWLVCLRLAREGAHVLVADNQVQKARKVSEEIVSLGNRSSFQEVDVSVKVSRENTFSV